MLCPTPAPTFPTPSPTVGAALHLPWDSQEGVLAGYILQLLSQVRAAVSEGWALSHPGIKWLLHLAAHSIPGDK